jgi:hypothetical protein
MSARNAGSAALRRDPLTRLFASVPLGFKLLRTPIAHGVNASIFQMDIQSSRCFGPYFRIWPGHRDNEIDVLSVDHGFRQLVLRVKEPRRPFVEIVRKDPWRRAAEVEERARATGGRILSETRHEWRLEMWTPEVERRYLCGRDDVELFIAQVRGGDTVAEAHASLAPWQVRQAATAAPGRILRQGEWFFLPVSDADVLRLESYLATHPRARKVRSPIDDRGRPHVADEEVTVDRRVRSKRHEWRRPEVYARGLVRHIGHLPLRLDGWRRVIRNREIFASAERVRWID